AEQHVDELAGIVADGRRRKRDCNLEQTLFDFTDGLDLPDDLAADEIVVDCSERHLDALLDRNGLRALGNRAGIAADMIEGGETGGHGRLDNRWFTDGGGRIPLAGSFGRQKPRTPARASDAPAQKIDA